MQSTVVRIPVDVLDKLKERAGSRPIGQMIAEDFLHEPDIQRLMEIRFDHLNERLDTLEKKFELFRGVQHEIHKAQLKAFTDLQDGIKQAFGNIIDRVNTVSKSLESRITQDEATLQQLAEMPGVLLDVLKRVERLEGIS